LYVSPPVWLSLLGALAAAQSPDYERGVALIQNGDYVNAVPFLARAVEASPRSAPAWKALGVAYAAQSLYIEAEPAFAKSCELDPGLPDACYYHGRALYALDRYEPSLKVLERLAKRDSRSWKVRLGIAQALEAIARAPEAEKSFTEAIALSRQSSPQPGAAYGLFLLRQGRAEEAIAALEGVLKHFPNAAEAHMLLGRALLEQERVEPAIPHLERAVALDPTSAQAHLLLAKAYVRAGRTADAQPHFEAAARYSR
jgi:tetratricopeptide (TPR) repeat protein